MLLICVKIVNNIPVGSFVENHQLKKNELIKVKNNFPRSYVSSFLFDMENPCNYSF